MSVWLSFFIIGLVWLLLHRRRRAALALALGAGLAADIVFPGATFGFWLFYNLGAWWLVDRLAGLVGTGRHWGITGALFFLSAGLYAAGLALASDLINFWQTGDSRAGRGDIWGIFGAAAGTAILGAVILFLINYGGSVFNSGSRRRYS